ncbi:MAG: hypothetical protein IKM43_01375 [Clostridia bacterium]|nr:hypothetical protein [Clostridia bacterium]
MWHLIFLFSTIMNILSFIYPFLLQFDVRFNILRLKGSVAIKIFNKFKFEFKIRIKNGYVYINHKKKIRKEKISNKNVKVLFILELIKQLYFREQVLQLNVVSNFGYVNNSATTAVTSGFIDVMCKSILSKIKNNKKLSHIFVSVEPKYNEDIFNIRIINTVRISVVDIIYTLIYTKINTWRKYEKDRKYST